MIAGQRTSNEQLFAEDGGLKNVQPGENVDMDRSMLEARSIAVGMSNVQQMMRTAAQNLLPKEDLDRLRQKAELDVPPEQRWIEKLTADSARLKMKEGSDARRRADVTIARIAQITRKLAITERILALAIEEAEAKVDLDSALSGLDFAEVDFELGEPIAKDGSTVTERDDNMDFDLRDDQNPPIIPLPGVAKKQSKK